MGAPINIATAMAGAPAAQIRERSIDTITTEIIRYKDQVGAAAVEIGRRLAEAKAMLPHGEWLPWLQDRVDFSEKQAQNLMRLAREYSNPQPVAVLGARKALALLAIAPEDREAFAAESHLVGGEEKTVPEMSARELEQAIRDRETALADKKAAEQARDTMAEDMRVANARLAQAKSDSESAAEREAALRSELEKLQKRPVEVPGAAVPDAAALEAARAEGASELQEKLTKAKEAKAKSDEKLKEAEAELEAVNQKLEELERQDKKTAIAADKDSATYAVLFEQGKELSNKMRGLLLKARAREDKSLAQMMEQSLMELGTAIMEAAK